MDKPIIERTNQSTNQVKSNVMVEVQAKDWGNFEQLIYVFMKENFFLS